MNEFLFRHGRREGEGDEGAPAPRWPADGSS